MSQESLVIGHATTPGVSSRGNQAAHLTMELEHEGQVVWVAVLTSSAGMMSDGTTASQFVVSQIYNGLIQSAQPIAARLREAIYRANLELIGMAGASANVERPHVSVLVTAITNGVLNVAYVGDNVAHLWRDGSTYPITANHNHYAQSASAQGIDSSERLGMYPDMPVHSLVIEPAAEADGGQGQHERYRMGESIMLAPNSLVVVGSSEIDTQYIGETIGRTGPNSDPGVLANGLVTSPTIVGGMHDVAAIVMRSLAPAQRKALISGRLMSALLGFVLFTGLFGGLVFAFPELSNRLRITAPASTELVGTADLNDSGTALSTGSPLSTDIASIDNVVVTSTTVPKNTSTETSTGEPTEEPTAEPTETPRQEVAMVATATPNLAPSVDVDESDIAPSSSTTNGGVADSGALIATSTPIPTPTPSPSATPTNTNTATSTPTDSQPATPTNTATATSTPTATNTSTATSTATSVPQTPTATFTATATATPRPTATKPTSDIRSLQLVSPQDNAQAGGRQKFEWTFWGKLESGQKFEVVFWEKNQQPIANGFGIAGATANTRISVDLDTLGRQLPLFRSGVAYNWGVLLISENPYTRLALLSDQRTFTFSPTSGSSSPDTAGE